MTSEAFEDPPATLKVIKEVIVFNCRGDWIHRGIRVALNAWRQHNRKSRVDEFDKNAF